MFAKRKTKRIEDIEKVVRNNCVDYYMNNDTMIVKHEFSEDMLTYLFCYYNIIEVVIQERLSINIISTFMYREEYRKSYNWERYYS